MNYSEAFIHCKSYFDTVDPAAGLAILDCDEARLTSELAIIFRDGMDITTRADLFRTLQDGGCKATEAMTPGQTIEIQERVTHMALEVLFLTSLSFSLNSRMHYEYLKMHCPSIITV